MANSDRHAERELRIFSEFAKVSPRRFDLTTLEKRQPRHPDVVIKCDGSSVAFELVELIDRDFARRIGVMIGTRRLLRTKLSELPDNHRCAFEAKYHNALLNFSFTDLPFHKRRGIIDTLLERLMELDETYEGRAFRDSEEFSGILNFVSIVRGEFVGPVLDVEASGFLGDPTLERLQDKFSRLYEADCPMELLAYIESHPMLPDESWLPAVDDFVGERLAESPFERVTIYDIHNATIRFEYPTL